MTKVCKIFGRKFLHHNSLSVIDEKCLNDVKKKYDTNHTPHNLKSKKCGYNRFCLVKWEMCSYKIKFSM